MILQDLQTLLNLPVKSLINVEPSHLAIRTSSFGRINCEGLRNLLDVVAEDFIDLKHRKCYLTNQDTSP